MAGLAKTHNSAQHIKVLSKYLLNEINDAIYSLIIVQSIWGIVRVC